MLLAGSGSAIGAGIRDVDRSEADQAKTEGGAFVDSVRTNGPAEKAGIKIADIIVQFDGERVRSARHLSRLIRETPPGRTVKATVARSGQRVELTVVPEGDPSRGGVFVDTDRLRDQLGRMGDQLFEGGWPGGRARLGVSVEDLTPQLATYFGVKSGVLVSSVTDNSPASRAGLKAGDVITSIDGHTVDSRAALLGALRESKDGQEIKLGIVRDKKETSLTAKVERWTWRRETV
jgi:S1-C subfamily serine protease